MEIFCGLGDGLNFIVTIATKKKSLGDILKEEVNT